MATINYGTGFSMSKTYAWKDPFAIWQSIFLAVLVSKRNGVRLIFSEYRACGSALVGPPLGRVAIHYHYSLPICAIFIAVVSPWDTHTISHREFLLVLKNVLSGDICRIRKQVRPTKIKPLRIRQIKLTEVSLQQALKCLAVSCFVTVGRANLVFT